MKYLGFLATFHFFSNSVAHFFHHNNTADITHYSKYSLLKMILSNSEYHHLKRTCFPGRANIFFSLSVFCYEKSKFVFSATCWLWFRLANFWKSDTYCRNSALVVGFYPIWHYFVLNLLWFQIFFNSVFHAQKLI